MERKITISKHGENQAYMRGGFNDRNTIIQIYEKSKLLEDHIMRRLDIGPSLPNDSRTRVCTRCGEHIFIAQITVEEEKIVTYINTRNNPGHPPVKLPTTGG